MLPSKKQRVAWSADGSAIVQNVEDLEGVLDRLAAKHGRDDPIILIVDGPGEESVYFGVSGDVSFVSSLEMPYLTTLGGQFSESQIDYFFEGHHSPVAGRHLIPADRARKIVREFFVSGHLPSWQAWEPVGP